MLIACAKALIDSNMGDPQPAAAFQAAMHFAFSGTGGGGWGDGSRSVTRAASPASHSTRGWEARC